MERLDQILADAGIVRPGLNLDRIKSAYSYSMDVCGGITRSCGDTVIDHVLAVVKILMPMHPDEDTIISALLHDAPKHPKYSKEKVKEMFGEEVCNMVEAVNMLRRIKSSDQKAELESFRKMFFALAKDIRVVLIKIADRIHNMKMSDFAPFEEKKLLAKETMDIYVPVTARLGIYNLKMTLEDLAFKYLYPQQYENLKAQLDEYISRTGKNIDDIKAEITQLLSDNKIAGMVEGRLKSLYSIYRKLKLKSHSTLSDLFDIFAMRVILPNRFNGKGQPLNDHLYAVLGLIHSNWTPLTNRFKDYIAVPKPNGYQSLHTAVIGIGKNGFQVTEIQIRTQSMHEQAEFGVASHWLYEDTKKATKSFKQTDSRDLAGVIETVGQYGDWINELASLQKELKSGTEVMHALKFDLFNDRIFVFTPNGDLKDLPQGATPIDFAYAVHSNIGNHAQVAKVNGQVVPLNYELQNGEVVEIVTNNRSEPKPQWLSFVKTTGAKTKIRSYLKNIDLGGVFKEGKDLINKYLEKDGKDLLDEELSLLKEYKGRKLNYRERAALVEEIGKRTFSVGTLIRNLVKKRPQKPDLTNVDVVKINKKVLPRRNYRKILGGNEVFIAGESGIPHKFANCCKPKVGQAIKGFLTRGNAVSIHLEGCKFLKHHSTPERIIDATWGKAFQDKSYPVKVTVTAKNRVGLIRDITQAISEMNIDIVDFGAPQFETVASNETLVSRDIVLNVVDEDQFGKVVSGLGRVMSVLEVNKTD